MMQSAARSLHIGDLGKLRPKVNFANHFTAPAGYDWGPRIIPDYQFVYILEGEATIEFSGQMLELRPGNCIFYGPLTPHRLAASPRLPFTLSSVHFSWDAESTEPVSPVPNIRPCAQEELEAPAPAYTVHVQGTGDVELWPFFDVQGLEGHFVRMAKQFLHQESGYEIVMRGYLLQLIGTLIRFQLDKRFRAESERGKIAAAAEAIRSRPAHAWTIPELAAIAGYHPTYFAELFREATGCTPKRYLVLERIKQAQQMLLQEKSVEAVASKLGYSSVHYFCRNFKAVTGQTPTEFKQRNWGF